MNWKSTLDLEVSSDDEGKVRLFVDILQAIADKADIMGLEVTYAASPPAQVCRTCESMGLDGWQDYIHMPASECRLAELELSCGAPEEHHEPD